MSRYITIVVRVPENPESKAQLQAGLELLKPYQTAGSSEDEITVLDFIEEHEDFATHIADDARERAAALLEANERLNSGST